MTQPELGIYIANLRKEQGLTQEELVEKCNINVRTIQRIEAGEVKPRSYTVKNILDALGTSIDEVFKEEKSKENHTLNINKGWLVTAVIFGFIYIVLSIFEVTTSLIYEFNGDKLIPDSVYICIASLGFVGVLIFYGTLSIIGKQLINNMFYISCLAFIIISLIISIDSIVGYNDRIEYEQNWQLTIGLVIIFFYGLGYLFMSIALFIERKDNSNIIKWAAISGVIGAVGFMSIILFPVGAVGTLLFEVLLLTFLINKIKSLA